MQTFSVLMKKKDDAMARLYGHLCGRGLQVQHVTAGTTEDGSHWNLTLVVDQDQTNSDKLIRELKRLMDVVTVKPLAPMEGVSRQYALLGVCASYDQRAFVRQMAEANNARVVQTGPEEMVLEMTGSQDTINAFMDNLRTVGKVRMNCTGPVALGGLERDARYRMQDAG